MPDFTFGDLASITLGRKLARSLVDPSPRVNHRMSLITKSLFQPDNTWLDSKAGIGYLSLLRLKPNSPTGRKGLAVLSIAVRELHR